MAFFEQRFFMYPLGKSKKFPPDLRRAGVVHSPKTTTKTYTQPDARKWSIAENKPEKINKESIIFNYAKILRIR